MTKLNKDGFAPGQSVSFGEIQATNSARKSQSNDAQPLSREAIAKLKKDELVELLAAHGADTDGKVDELRERVIAVVFMDA